MMMRLPAVKLLGTVVLALVLGIALAQTLTSRQFVRVFTDPDIGFVCELSPLLDGRQRTLCESRNGLVLMELIGPTRNLDQADMLILPSSNDPVHASLSALYAVGFVKIALPNWEGASAWMADALTRAHRRGSASTRRGGYLIEVEVNSSFRTVLVTIEPRR